MFKNAERDPLAVPAHIQRRSVGPTHRTAGVPWAETKNAPQREHEKYDLDPDNWEDRDDDKPSEKTSSVPRKVAQTLRLEASNFLAEHECPESRSETLYRAQRHARTLTSTWTPEAAQRAVQAFVSQVAELIPNRPKVAAAQTSTFEDFDDQLLY
jgi:hypothetical protein